MNRNWVPTLLAVSILVTAWAATGWAAPQQVAPFSLQDQHGKTVDVMDSNRVTLLTFYRGDW